jgi:hypothetical protein
MNAKAVLVGVVTVAVAVALIALIAIGGDSDDGPRGTSTGLPAVEGDRPPTDYRIVYRVTTQDSVGEEEHVVHRPFGAHVVNRDSAGAVTSERWSDLGRLVTRSQGARAVRIDTAIATSANDLRPDRFADRLAEAGKVTPADVASTVGGRACRRIAEADTVPVENGETLPVTIDRCVDATGLVLEERWTTPDDDVVLSKRARVLEIGDDVPAIRIPDAEPLPAEQGNGAVRKVADDERPPFAEAFALDVPDGFTFVGRYSVSAASPTSDVSAVPEAGTEVALYTDVWTRGPDVLLLDQGATEGAAPPFDRTTTIGTVPLGGIGDAELGVDLRSAEVRMARPDDGFLRLSGTIPLDDLLALASSSLHIVDG